MGETMTATLRPLEKRDLDNILSWVNDPTVVGRFGWSERTYTREDEEQYIDTILRSEHDRVYTVEEDGVYIGQAGLHEIDWNNRTARTAVIIGNKAYWGKHYGESMMEQLVHKGFSELGLRHIYSTIRADNDKVRHICEKIGMREEQQLPSPYVSHGQSYPMIQLGVYKVTA